MSKPVIYVLCASVFVVAISMLAVWSPHRQSDASPTPNAKASDDENIKRLRSAMGFPVSKEQAK
jgi:hypothetical protein